MRKDGAIVAAEKLFAIWKHLNPAECLEQVEAHMESDGWSPSARERGVEFIADSLGWNQ